MLLLVILDGAILCHYRGPTQEEIDYGNEVTRTLKIEREYYKRHPEEYQEKLNKIRGYTNDSCRSKSNGGR